MRTFVMTKWWDEFQKSISNGDNTKILSALKKVSVSKTYDRKGNGLLHYISKSKTDNDVIAAYLIAAGCDVNVKNHMGDPPLAMAIVCRNVKVAKKLLDAGALHMHTDFKNDFGPLHIATYTRCLDMVKVLLKAGASVKSVDRDGYTPLHVAIISYSKGYRRNNFKLVKALIEAGSNVNAKPKEGYTPFVYAIICGLNDVVEQMLTAGAEVNGKGQLAMTPLFLAVLKDNVELARRLVAAGAQVNATDLNGRTCLHYAASSLNAEMVKLLLDNGATVNVFDKEDISPLLCCSHSCNVNLSDIEMRIPNGRDCDQIIEDTFPGQTAVKVECMKLLLEHGADPNYVSESFPTPILYTALILSHSVVVNLLLTHGANVNFDHDYIRVATRIRNYSNSLHQLMRHTAICNALNQKDGPIKFDVEKLTCELQNDYLRCGSELELMKNTNIHGSVSLFKMLSDKDIGPYARNRNVIKAFVTKCTRKRFPIYGIPLRERFSKEIELQNLRKTAMHKFSGILKWDENSWIVILDNIFRFLNEKDLQALISV
ncbi:uncharacterized protein LOC106644674 [Copidosoma floridanum]|uniref:uncharacterized protein LOC106644674 n=1 Tax=Copidosoma floridanum TaxID=29053 RepID=UPI0006C9AE66|nr:uncharacterized protein LOC106644674 [Copidosoma floridanum]